MVEEKICISCNRPISSIPGSTSFKCPKCGYLIVRCGDCRKTGVKYKCPNCGFEGP